MFKTSVFFTLSAFNNQTTAAPTGLTGFPLRMFLIPPPSAASEQEANVAGRERSTRRRFKGPRSVLAVVAAAGRPNLFGPGRVGSS